MNIYIGNLPFNLGEEDLKEIFEEYGEVTSAKIISDKITGRSKGFGFVEMDNDAEATKAIKELNNSEVSGRNIKVNESKPKTSQKILKKEEEFELNFEGLNIYIDKGTASKDDIVKLLTKINKLYRLHGGNGIVFSKEDIRVFELSNSYL